MALGYTIPEYELLTPPVAGDYSCSLLKSKFREIWESGPVIFNGDPIESAPEPSVSGTGPRETADSPLLIHSNLRRLSRVAMVLGMVKVH